MNSPRARYEIFVAALLSLAAAYSSIASDQGPDTENSLLFSHELHVVENELSCQDCHSDIPTSTSLADRNLPEMDVCGDCHDIEDEETCGMCHRDPENPEAARHREFQLLFSHETHLEAGEDCARCHGPITSDGDWYSNAVELKSLCNGCHDIALNGDRCSSCHTESYALQDIHPGDWRHNHAEQALNRKDWCGACHESMAGCSDCHFGDNLDGTTHELNYEYTHGLDARSRKYDCTACHDRQTFCNDCHLRELRLPLNHSTSDWSFQHGVAARRDVEDCASCHDQADQTCARSGCHNDYDGIRGTDPRFHSGSLARGEMHGPWHGDDGYVCYQCHVNTHTPGDGFCGYCHR